MYTNSIWRFVGDPLRWNGRRRLRFDADLVVDSSANSLLAPEIAFSRLHGNVPEKKLDLFQLSARSVAQLRARTPQIMRRYIEEPEFPSVLFHNMPDDSLGYASPPGFASPTDTSKESSGRNPGSSRPAVDGRFDPLRHRNRSNMAAFADQIDYGPMFLALLQVREVQISQFAAAKSAAK